MNLYHVLVNEKGEPVFAQREEWGKHSVCMHALLTGEVKTVPGHTDVYYSFWNPANPTVMLDEGWILFFLEAESLIEAISKTGPIWWGIGDIKDLRHPPAVSHKRLLSPAITNQQSGAYQKLNPHLRSKRRVG